jgi:thymidylate synthase
VHVITARNVCEALPAGLEFLRTSGERHESRNGPVLVAPTPVTTVYENPRERVLFSAARDANPFFHLAESIWMLRGQNDSAPLDHFVHDFGIRYAESNGLLHGAYGFRWRQHWGYDQLHSIIHRLESDPEDRRSVIGMWDPDVDLYCPDTVTPRDLPCNTHIYFRVREKKLDMTICCRSNDIIWGAYGANAVHFSVLLEYIAAHAGYEVGRMFQVSNNYHAYQSEIDRLHKRGGHMDNSKYLHDNRYDRMQPLPLIFSPKTFDLELMTMGDYEEPFFRNTFSPMMEAWDAWKNAENPLPHLMHVEADDWREACVEWILRRKIVN